ncbi:MAG: hypothetical protein A2089_03830 [Elusimicrobia bacterium GWD2_63_28]|nr:MAG: hypothetical protein A2089_03830 [Elusimicrobia bacterium GWD2_63_28]
MESNEKVREAVEEISPEPVQQEMKVKPAEPKAKVAVKTAEGFLAGFVNNTLGNRTRYRNYSTVVEGGVTKLIYTGFSTSFNYTAQKTETKVDGTDELAIRLPCGIVLSNANRLKYCGTHVVFGGQRSYTYAQAPAQAILQKAGAIPVPFQIFADAKLNLLASEILEKAPEETITVTVKTWKNNEWVPQDETRHYVGACLLKVGEEYFLFDIDREELKHKVFNPFMVKLPRAAKTVAEAYELLKPAKVVMAEMGGIQVERQGEWFFIHRMDELPELPPPPADLKAIADNPPDARQMGAETNAHYRPGGNYCYSFSDSEQERIYEQRVKELELAVESVRAYAPRQGELRQGNNRPNRVEKFLALNGVILVSGLVKHTGREHRDVMLKGWWEPVPNTAVSSWQVTGEID